MKTETDYPTKKSTELTSQESPGFTIRAGMIAIVISLFLLMSTFYIAVKLGAAPWPIIFSVIVSGALLKALNRRSHVNIHEINVAQAGGSIGGLVAAGVAFTLPGIIYLNRTHGLEIELPNPWLLGILIVLAGLLGIILSVPLKYTFVDEEQLPYPAGTAGAELLKLGKTGGRMLFFLLIIGSLTGIFTLFRDVYFPVGFAISALSTFGIILVFLPLPIAVGAGYILGPRASLSWLAGAVVGWLILVPIFVINDINIKTASDYTQNLGMGIVLGSGVSFFVTYILPRFKKIFLSVFSSSKYIKRLLPWLLIAGFLGLFVNGVPVYATLMTLVGVWAMVAIAARMTGETNIDPLEQFGIFITLLIAFIYNATALSISTSDLFVIALFVSVACAVAGDAGHDYKSASIIGTRFFDIVKVDVIAVVVTGLSAPFIFEIIRQGFSEQLFTAVLPAPQSRLVAGSIFGFEYPLVFLTGFGIAFAGETINNFMPEKYKNIFLWMPFGIGLFLGMGLALPIAIGAIIHIWIQKKRPTIYHSGILIAAGIMGAEGISGFSAGALTIVGISFQTAAIILGIILIIILFLSSILYYFKTSQ